MKTQFYQSLFLEEMCSIFSKLYNTLIYFLRIIKVLLKYQSFLLPILIILQPLLKYQSNNKPSLNKQFPTMIHLIFNIVLIGQFIDYIIHFSWLCDFSFIVEL